MGEHIKTTWNKLTNFFKEVTTVTGGIVAIAGVLIWIGTQLTSISTMFKDYNETVPLVRQLVTDLKVIQEEFKTQESYRKTVEELKIYTVSEVDWLINDTKWRINNKMSLGYSYIQRLEHYEQNLSFLTLEQKRDITYIKKVYYKQITP